MAEDPKKLKVERLRRSGPGGQHRNKRATGIRMTHVPSGTTVMATERRSQAQNLQAAADRLEAELRRRAAKPKPRVPTKKSRRAQERRLASKHQRQKIKANRRRPSSED